MNKILDVRPERVDILTEMDTAMMVTIELSSEGIPVPMTGYTFSYVAENEDGVPVVSGSTEDGHISIEENVVTMIFPADAFSSPNIAAGSFRHALWYQNAPTTPKKLFSGFLKVQQGVKYDYSN